MMRARGIFQLVCVKEGAFLLQPLPRGAPPLSLSLVSFVTFFFLSFILEGCGLFLEFCTFFWVLIFVL